MSEVNESEVNESEVEQLRKELARVTRQRDAARTELAQLLNENRNVSEKCSGEWETCYCETCSRRRAERASRDRFFMFVSRCGELLGLDVDKTTELLHDRSWFFCFDDGLTPEQAVEAFKKNR